MKINASNQLTGSTAAPIPASAHEGSYNRRKFVTRVLAAGAAAKMAALAVSSRAQEPTHPVRPGGNPHHRDNPALRRLEAYNVRVQAALAEMQLPLPPHPDNGDEDRYPNKLGSFS